MRLGRLLRVERVQVDDQLVDTLFGGLPDRFELLAKEWNTRSTLSRSIAR